MNQDTGSRIVSALTAERNALRDFVALLEREQGALVENLTDQLLELAERKSAQALSLSQLASARHGLLKNNIPGITAESIPAWLQAHHAQGVPIWREIRELADRARQLNQNNGELIQLKLRYNQQALTAMGNAARKANLYGPNGQPNLPSAGPGRTLGSV